MKRIPYPILIVGSLFLGLAPFVPEPHLFEKLRMLFGGQLSEPIDIFDLFLHGSLPALLLVKATGDLLGKVAGGRTGPGKGEADE